MLEELILKLESAGQTIQQLIDELDKQKIYYEFGKFGKERALEVDEAHVIISIDNTASKAEFLACEFAVAIDGEF